MVTVCALMESLSDIFIYESESPQSLVNRLATDQFERGRGYLNLFEKSLKASVQLYNHFIRTNMRINRWHFDRRTYV